MSSDARWLRGRVGQVRFVGAVMSKGDNRSHRDFAALTFLALPFIIYLYPAVALLAAKSDMPIFFDLYSGNLLVLNVITVLVYGAFLFGIIAERLAIQFVSVFVLSIVTMVATNNSVSNLKVFDATAQLARIFAGFALILLAFLADKRGRSWLSAIGLGVGSIVAFGAIVDLGFASISNFLRTEKADQIYRQYRVPYDLTKVTDQDIVLVGDSFVWGSGVRVDERFGDILQRRLNAEKKMSRIYSLGVIGANIKGYIQQIQDLPVSSKANQVILCFYANDMPPRATLRDTLQQLAEIIRRRSVVLAAIADLFQLALTPSAEVYANLLLSQYLEDDETFELRWKELDRELRTFYQLAETRSYKRPMIMILPMLVHFDTGAFESPMRRVSNLAARIGFGVVDTMPAFRADGGRAERYRAAPNDLHLNERGNKLVADVLFRAILDAPQDH